MHNTAAVQADHTIPGWHGAAIPLHLLAFGVDGFDPAAFAEHGIAFPPHIAASVPKRQAAFLAGRLAARRALAPFGLGERDVGSGAFREPLWPAGMTGSITHSQSLAAAVALRLQPGHGIGIDIETIAAGEALRALMQIAVSAGELAYLESVSGRLPLATLVSLVFSAKESFFKAAFPLVGAYFGFDAVRASHIDIERGQMRLLVCQPLCRELAPGRLAGANFRLLDGGAILTSCYLGPEA